jgi:hypothetical protein
MDDVFQSQLAALGNEVRTATIPEDCKQTAAWCFGRLAPLYAKFRQTSESRFGDEISRLVKAALAGLTTGADACPQGRQLAGQIADRLRLLHERFGLPRLSLPAAPVSTRRSRKAVIA